MSAQEGGDNTLRGQCHQAACRELLPVSRQPGVRARVVHEHARAVVLAVRTVSVAALPCTAGRIRWDFRHGLSLRLSIVCVEELAATAVGVRVAVLQHELRRGADSHPSQLAHAAHATQRDRCPRQRACGLQKAYIIEWHHGGVGHRLDGSLILDMGRIKSPQRTDRDQVNSNTTNICHRISLHIETAHQED